MMPGRTDIQRILILGVGNLLTLLLLPACSLFDNSDPREGAEAVEDCVERVAQDELQRDLGRLSNGGDLFIPTYTYDITKLDLESMQSLIVTGSDETAGSRGMTSTNQTSTAVDNFMQQPVDEKGSFFLGRDPALYRVRGAPVTLEKVIAAGCERQLPGMRLISLKASAFTPVPDDTSPDDPEDENAS